MSDSSGAFVNVIQAWPTTEIYNMSGKHLTVMISFVAEAPVGDLKHVNEVRQN